MFWVFLTLNRAKDCELRLQGLRAQGFSRRCLGLPPSRGFGLVGFRLVKGLGLRV